MDATAIVLMNRWCAYVNALLLIRMLLQCWLALPTYMLCGRWLELHLWKHPKMVRKNSLQTKWGGGGDRCMVSRRVLERFKHIFMCVWGACYGSVKRIHANVSAKTRVRYAKFSAFCAPRPLLEPAAANFFPRSSLMHRMEYLIGTNGTV